jgi:hypothetical protein
MFGDMNSSTHVDPTAGIPSPTEQGPRETLDKRAKSHDWAVGLGVSLETVCYSRDKHLPELFDELLSAVLDQKPDDPIAFMRAWLVYDTVGIMWRRAVGAIKAYTAECITVSPSPACVRATGKALRFVRKQLSIPRHPPIQRFVDADILADVVALGRCSDSDVALDALWSLTNVASGSAVHTQYIAECSAAIDLFADALLDTSQVWLQDLKDQACWAVGNVAGEGSRYRDILLSVPGLVGAVATRCSSPGTDVVHRRNALWTVSNLCRGKPPPPLEKIGPVLQHLKIVFETVTDEASLVDALWAVSYISDGSNDRIQAVIDSGVLNFIPALLKGYTLPPAPFDDGSSAPREHDYVQTPSIPVPPQAIGYMLKFVPPGKKLQDLMFLCKDWLYDVFLLDINLYNCARAPATQSVELQTPALRTCGNIVTGTDVQTDAALDLGLLPFLENLMVHAKRSIRKECAWTLSNITAGSTAQIDKVLAQTTLTQHVRDRIWADEPDVVKELTWAVANAFEGCQPHQVAPLLRAGFGTALLAGMVQPDAKAYTVALEGISSLLRHISSDSASPVRRSKDEMLALCRSIPATRPSLSSFAASVPKMAAADHMDFDRHFLALVSHARSTARDEIDTVVSQHYACVEAEIEPWLRDAESEDD